jgi:hypothetical protein
MNAPRRRNPRDDPFHDGPRPTPGHDMGDRYDYRKECPPEQTRERDRSTGIADAYYAAYLAARLIWRIPPRRIRTLATNRALTRSARGGRCRTVLGSVKVTLNRGGCSTRRRTIRRRTGARRRS